MNNAMKAYATDLYNILFFIKYCSLKNIRALTSNIIPARSKKNNIGPNLKLIHSGFQKAKAVKTNTSNPVVNKVFAKISELVIFTINPS
jgi:hypothetical protein